MDIMCPRRAAFQTNYQAVCRAALELGQCQRAQSPGERRQWDPPGQPFVPKMPGLYQLDGYIKVSSDNSTIEIPVSVSLKGSEIRGLNSEEVQDVDGDGRFDLLTLGFGVNVSIPGEFRLEGVANDCQGNRIDVIDQSLRLDETGEILVNISGTDIWAGGQCGPMKIENLILYDKVGSYLTAIRRYQYKQVPRSSGMAAISLGLSIRPPMIPSL